jgi:hypothetical protein
VSYKISGFPVTVGQNFSTIAELQERETTRADFRDLPQTTTKIAARRGFEGVSMNKHSRVGMKRLAVSLVGIAASLYWSIGSAQQIFPPGQFALDGYPVVCGNAPTIVTPQIPDAAMNNGQAILLNPMVMGRLPTVLKLFVYAHECGHFFAGSNETGADCWAIRTGRDQGWFPPQAFQALIAMFRNNPGSMRHPPGMIRVNNMMTCYQTP